MNRDQKAAVIEEVAGQIQESEAVFAVDYRGISVPQAAELRTRLRDADARFRVVKNTLTERAADQAGAESLKELLEGPTALTFVRGDAAAAAKALARLPPRRPTLLEFKGGWMNGEPLRPSRSTRSPGCPSRDVLYGRLVGMVASPITGLVTRAERADRRPRPPAAADRRAGPGGRRGAAGARSRRPRPRRAEVGSRAEPTERRRSPSPTPRSPPRGRAPDGRRPRRPTDD